MTRPLLLLLLPSCAEPTAAEPTGWLPSTAAPELGSSPPPPVTAGLVINEVMASNESTISEPPGVFPDWLELYNPGPEVVAPSSVTLTDAGGGVWTGPERALAPGDHLLITRAELTLSSASLSALHRDPYTDTRGGLRFESASFPEVAVRLKGSFGSFRALAWGKAAFKVDLDDYEAYRLRGMEHITWNNAVQDPSYVREALAYAVWRAAGVPAPRAGWTRLSLNGEYRGLYVLLESIDDHFLERWYGPDFGTLYEGTPGADLVADNLIRFELDEGPDEMAFLEEVTALLEGAPSDALYAETQSVIDWDQVLRFLAVENLLAHWDGYIVPNNFFLRVSADQRIQLLPWGTDQAFEEEGAPGAYDGEGLLRTWCLAAPACAARYDATLIAMSHLMEGLEMEAELDLLYAALIEEIEADPYREHGMDVVEATFDETRRVIRERPAALRAEVEE